MMWQTSVKQALNPCAGPLSAGRFAIIAVLYMAFAPIAPNVMNGIWVALQMTEGSFIMRTDVSSAFYYTVILIPPLMPLLIWPASVRRLRGMGLSALWSVFVLQACVLAPVVVSVIEEALGLYEPSYDEGFGGTAYFFVTLASQTAFAVFLAYLVIGKEKGSKND